MVPAGHDLLIEHDSPFRVCLSDNESLFDSINRQSQFVNGSHFALLECLCRNETWNLELIAYGNKTCRISSVIEFLPVEPDVASFFFDFELLDCRQLPMSLLTNGRGAMSRMSAWLGESQSKYDSVLAANLHPTLPVDRWVMAKRLRV
jgi:hypothetical protein